MQRLKKRYGCPVEFSLELLGGKWKPVIMARLKERPLRYGELRARVPGLSDKMLSERLRDLKAAGLVRNDTGQGGSPDTYALTPRGESLRPVLEALYDWGHSTAISDGVIVDGL